jgi:hypothetical protein
MASHHDILCKTRQLQRRYLITLILWCILFSQLIVLCHYFPLNTPLGISSIDRLTCRRLCLGVKVRQKMSGTVNSLLLQFVVALITQKLLHISYVQLVVYSSPVSFTPLYQFSLSTLQVWENINSKHSLIRTFLTD